MDATGKVIGSPDDRTVESFKKHMKFVQEFIDIKAKADKGDPAAKIEYFIRALKIEEFKKLDEARKYLATLKNVSKEQKAEIDKQLTGLEVRNLWVEILETKDAAKKSELQKSTGKKFLEMEKAGRLPAGDDDFAKFHVVILDYAQLEKNIPVFEKSLEAIKERFGDKLNQRFLATKEKILETMKEEKERKEEPKDK